MLADAHALDRGLGAAQELRLDGETRLDLARLRLQAQVEHEGEADQRQRDQRLDQAEAARPIGWSRAPGSKRSGCRQSRDTAGRTFGPLERRAIPADRGLAAAS